jgi:hypothetical protein
MKPAMYPSIKIEKPGAGRADSAGPFTPCRQPEVDSDVNSILTVK